MPLYTPFFERATAKIGAAKRQRDVGEAARNAYGSGEFGDLYAQAPELAGQMERTNLQRQQVEAQTQAAQAQAQRQASQDRAKQQALVSDLQKELSPKAAEFDTPEEFNDFVENQALARGVQNVDRIDQANFDLLKKAYPDDQVGQRRDKIDAMTEMFGDAVENPREIATKLQDGILEISVSDDGQTVTLTDKIKAITDPSNSVINLPINNLKLEEPRVQPQTGQTLYELAQTVGGVEGSIKQLLSNVAGQFGFSAFEEEMEAYQTLNTAVGDMTRSLMVGERWTVGQASMLREEIDIKPGILSPGPVTNMRMRSINRSLELRLSQFERDSIDMSLAPDERSALKTNASTIRNFIDLLGVPKELKSEDLTMESMGSVNRNDASSILLNMTSDEWESLSPEIRSALRDKAGV